MWAGKEKKFFINVAEKTAVGKGLEACKSTEQVHCLTLTNILNRKIRQNNIKRD